MANGDITPGGIKEYWTVALVREGHKEDGDGYKEVHFGVFSIDDAIKALNSGMVQTAPDEHVELRRIRAFPV